MDNDKIKVNYLSCCNRKFMFKHKNIQVVNNNRLNILGLLLHKIRNYYRILYDLNTKEHLFSVIFCVLFVIGIFYPIFSILFTPFSFASNYDNQILNCQNDLMNCKMFNIYCAHKFDYYTFNLSLKNTNLRKEERNEIVSCIRNSYYENEFYNIFKKTLYEKITSLYNFCYLLFLSYIILFTIEILYIECSECIKYYYKKGNDYIEENIPEVEEV